MLLAWRTLHHEHIADTAKMSTYNAHAVLMQLPVMLQVMALHQMLLLALTLVVPLAVQAAAIVHLHWPGRAVRNLLCLVVLHSGSSAGHDMPDARSSLQVLRLPELSNSAVGYGYGSPSDYGGHYTSPPGSSVRSSGSYGQTAPSAQGNAISTASASASGLCHI